MWGDKIWEKRSEIEWYDGESDFLEEDDSEDGQYEEEDYSNLIRFIDLVTPCGGSINYSGCIHVNFVDVNK